MTLYTVNAELVLTTEAEDAEQAESVLAAFVYAVSDLLPNGEVLGVARRSVEPVARCECGGSLPCEWAEEAGS